MVWIKGMKRSLETRNKIRLSMLGRKHSQESINKIIESRLGDKNPLWKGDNVGYINLHLWIRRNLKMSKKCDICNSEDNIDLANITGIYNRDFKNWKYLCRSCHMKSDGRMNNLKQYKLRDCSDLA